MKKMIMAAVAVLVSSLNASAIFWSTPVQKLDETVVVGCCKYELMYFHEWGYGAFACVTGFYTDESQVPEKVEVADYVKIYGTSYPVKRVWRKAFENCKKRHEFILPETIQGIESLAFSNSPSVKIKLNSNVVLMDSVFYNTKVENPEELSKVFFFHNYSLTGSTMDKLNFGSDLVLLAPQALKQSNIPFVTFLEQKPTDNPELETVSFICAQSFIKSNVEEVRLSRRSALGARVFYDCPKLKRVIFPEAELFVVQRIGLYQPLAPSKEDESIYKLEPPEYYDDLFIAKCPALKEVVSLSVNPPEFYRYNGNDADSKSFTNRPLETSYGKLEGERNIIDDHEYCVLKVPSGSEELYRAHPIWGKFKNIEGFQPGEYTGIEGGELDSSVDEIPEGGKAIKAVAGDNGLEMEIDHTCTVEIYSLTGALVLHTQHRGGLFHADLPKGVYLMRKL